MAKKKSKKPESSVIKPTSVRKSGTKLITGWQNLKASALLLKHNQRLFGGITLVYVLLTILLVRGLSQGQLVINKEQSKSLQSGLSLVGNLFSASNTGSTQAATTYQTLLLVLISLVLIWALRQVHGQDKPQAISVKTAFYKGCYPIIQFILVLLVVSLQFLPLAIGTTMYSYVINNSLAVGGLEKLVWSGVFLALAVWSLYMVTASIFALYIVTLPDVTPMQALRSAKELVRYRRWTVMRKLLFLPLALVIGIVVVMLPLVLWLPFVAAWAFLLISLGLLAIVHAYIYNLYRELL